jgi:hypothetical protein
MRGERLDTARRLHRQNPLVTQIFSLIPFNLLGIEGSENLWIRENYFAPAA